jgi:hypothetical protein
LSIHDLSKNLVEGDKMKPEESYAGNAGRNAEYVLPGLPTPQEVAYLGDCLARKYGPKESPVNERGLTAMGEMLISHKVQPEPENHKSPRAALTELGAVLLEGVPLPRMDFALKVA